jgi:hypothetical protein
MLHTGMGTNQDWVRSLTTISSPLRGTTTCYILGAHEQQAADHLGRVRFWSPGSFLSKAIHIYEWLDVQALKKVLLCFSLALRWLD